MTKVVCPSETSLLRFVDDDLPREQAELVNAHLQRCPACREHERTLCQHIADMKAALPLNVDIEQHVRSVLAAIDAAPVPARDSASRARRIAAFAVAASAALLPLGYFA